MFKKAKSNPGLGVPENKVSNIITKKMKDTSELNYYSLSQLDPFKIHVSNKAIECIR